MSKKSDDIELRVYMQEHHTFCKVLATTTVKNALKSGLKFKRKNIDVIQFNKNDGHYEVHLNELEKEHRSMTSCCKWSALSQALQEYIKEQQKGEYS